MIGWLADRRQELRNHFEEEERKASRGLRPRLEVEPLYVVNWHHAEAPADEVLEAWGDAIRTKRPWPPVGHAKLDLSDDQLAVLKAMSNNPRLAAQTGAAPPKGTAQPPVPGNRLLVDWATFRESVGVSGTKNPALETGPEPELLPPDDPEHEAPPEEISEPA